ncbi:rubrerythrin [Kaistia dalseonensis]|uniref:Rubrerythrin n=1 Tax=Kaistia dalseonensis TaxID=410840 RepID=A0ABU0HC14_9HYPH|nr:ferritin family protein [Kaistia dalseonensis]MDQ0439847.1 rubrerythrin [Kaistia dalseonensis]
MTAREVLALAIGAEEEDARRYRDMAERLAPNFPGSAKVFDEMADEEDGHRHLLIDLFRKKFGEHIPLVRRDDVSGFVRHPPVWSLKTISVDGFRHDAATMELQAQRFYLSAAERATDPDVRALLGDLAAMEAKHERKAEELEAEHLGESVRTEEDATRRRMFVMQIVQPGLAGLIDGSISTLAPIFAAAFATQHSFAAFQVGLAASIGAGISMGLTEALSDDGVITGRGVPWVRGAVCGLMTTIGGLGHTLPYLIPDFWTATAVAGVVVAAELIAISWIRWHYMDTPLHSALAQVVLGGVLVLLTGIFIGSA